MTDNPGSRRGRLIALASVAAGAAVGIVVWVWAGGLSTTSTAAEESTTPTSGTPGNVSDHSTTTLSQELLSYLTKIDEVAASIAGLAVEMEAINDGFDADPREIEFLEATERLEDLVGATNSLVVTIQGIAAPDGFGESHYAVLAGVDLALAAGEDTLFGLRSPDPGRLRRQRAHAFVEAVAHACDTMEDAVGTLIGRDLECPPAPAGDAADLEYLYYTGDQFNELFRTFPFPGLQALAEPPSITGSKEVDDRIRDLAHARGYRLQPVPVHQLMTVQGHRLQREAIESWMALQEESASRGHRIFIDSAYRSIDEQRAIFRRRLTGNSAASIRALLAWIAPPGYSRHQTGVAVDVLQAGFTRVDFRRSPAFAWLSANNFEAPRRHGFIPSYPDDATSQGPNPETWEYVYVGVENVECGRLNLGSRPRFLPQRPMGSLHELRLCPQYPLARGPSAFYLAEALGLRGGETVAFTDIDDQWYRVDVAALAKMGVVEGCEPPLRFCPDELLTRDSLRAALSRLGVAGAEEAYVSVFGADDDVSEEPVTRGELADLLQLLFGVVIPTG